MKKNNWKLKAGIALMIASIVPFLSIPVVPFLHVANGLKVTLTTLFIVLGEVFFWSGGLLVGKELFTKYKSYLNPTRWFRKRTSEGPDTDRQSPAKPS